jgi:hypothetical protein
LIGINGQVPKIGQIIRNITIQIGGRVMVGVTLSPEQIRTAPPEVRRWLEQELLASFGLQQPTTEPDAPQLAAYSVEEASTILSLIQGMLPVVNVFFELGRDGTSADAGGMVAFRLTDILRHTRLQTLEQVIACLDTISKAARRVRGVSDAPFYGLDNRGHCFISAETQRSILHVWQQIIAARNLDTSRASVSGPEIAMPVIPSSGVSGLSYPWPAPTGTGNFVGQDRNGPADALESV